MDPEDKAAAAIERFIDNLRAERRLYPDTYARDLAKAVLEALEDDA